MSRQLFARIAVPAAVVAAIWMAGPAGAQPRPPGPPPGPPAGGPPAFRPPGPPAGPPGGLPAFRPPGGEPTSATATLLRELGYRWWSPLGDTPGRQDGLAVIPFEWELVDAYHLMEHFGDLRVRQVEGLA